ncbi:uncharacterized protein PAC_15699 [Phialocephala subalpina]|uniref:C2H2-type domain-containing protein n=1 Tax=Phialocephala subalpina TaxID=576137 RepID=A0A1L7XL76_9HELO|nr:uncharacterized protein PAC_15699 [Phialocephala subalpina]
MDERATSFFQCQDCPKSFSKRMDYNRHRKNHDKPFSCVLCGRKFGLKTGLERHRLTHLWQTQGFRCTFPGCELSGVARKDYLWQHIKKKHQTPDMEDPEDVLRPYYHKALSNEKRSQSRNDFRDLEFLEAVCEGGADKVKDLIRDGVPLSTDMRSVGSSKSAAQIAVERGHVSVLKALIEAGIDLRVESAIYEAARKGHVEMVEVMLDAGIDIESEMRYFVGYMKAYNGEWRGYEGLTALSITAIFGQVPTAQMLLDRGAQIDAPSQVVNLYIYGHVDVVRILTLHDCRSPRTYAYGATMLHLVAVKHECLITELIGRGFDTNATDLEGMTPLSYALGRHPFTAQAGKINEGAVDLLLYESEVSEADLDVMPSELRAEYDDWCESKRHQKANSMNLW